MGILLKEVYKGEEISSIVLENLVLGKVKALSLLIPRTLPGFLVELREVSARKLREL